MAYQNRRKRTADTRRPDPPRALVNRGFDPQSQEIPSYGAGVEAVSNEDHENRALGLDDDAFDGPTVTPVPAPPDDQLIRLAKVGTILGALASIVVARWFHKHFEIRWRS